jgi:hippurate hydrolase
LLAAIERVTRGIALAAGIPENLAPIVNVSTEGTVATYNDPALTERLAKVFVKALGQDNVVSTPQIMASEDFAYYSLEGHQIPSLIFWVGAVDPPKVKQSRESGVPLPTLHSALFAPLPEPTIRTGIRAMTSAVLELMKK